MMDCCGTDVSYKEIHGDGFYFQVDTDTDIESDDYTVKSDTSVKWIKNKDNKFLLVQHDDQLLFEALRKGEQEHCACKFKIKTCRKNPHNPIDRGVAVLLYVDCVDKYKLVSCDDQGKVHVDTQESLPSSFKDTGDKILFFLRSETGCKNTFMIEPSLCQSHLLGFEDESDDLLKLVARKQNHTETDARSLFTMEACN